MSGSSTDGVDLAACLFSRSRKGWTYRLLASETYPYPSGLKNRLLHAVSLPPEQVYGLDLELGAFYGNLIHAFHQSAGFSPALIASHGHTIFHRPDKGITLQAGNGKVMASLTKIPVVNDFRKEDVAQGGQGAPLVPAGDRLLFGEYEVCLNLGGISNLSYDNEYGRRIAYDICPVNLALNYLAGLEGRDYDKDGEIARRGRIDKALLRELEGLAFYSANPPKSLGREWFLEAFLPRLMGGDLPVCDRMATAVEHIGMQIGSSIRRSGAGTVLVTGGGALNIFLVERLRSLVSSRIILPEEQIVLFKEALVFAFLGLLRSIGEINCLASVTGGRRDLSAGTIHEP
jgi:anhydro-N-acetylmuramic acid kinase